MIHLLSGMTGNIQSWFKNLVDNDNRQQRADTTR